MRYLVYALLLLLYVLHTDVWYWNDPSLALGLPIGITYHLFWSLAVMGVFWLAVEHAWPQELEEVGSTRAGGHAEDPAGDASPARMDGSSPP